MLQISAGVDRLNLEMLLSHEARIARIKKQCDKKEKLNFRGFMFKTNQKKIHNE